MDFESLVTKAKERRSMPLSYTGDVTAQEAWECLSEREDAALVDVRTPPEWSFSGVPNLSAISKQPICISWRLFPHYTVNEQFISALAEAGVGKSTPLFFLCRTGGRSLDAACAVASGGYEYCFNIAHGFEGDLDEHKHRSSINGWKAEHLPWEQA